MSNFLKFGLLAFLMSFAVQAGSKCGEKFAKNDRTTATCVLRRGHKQKNHSDKVKNSNGTSQDTEQGTHGGPVLSSGIQSSTAGY